MLEAMGAATERPPRLRGPRLPDDPCWPAPERTWGWAVQLYALRSRDSWGIGDLADLRRFARWSRRAGASLILLNPLGAQTPTLPYQPSPYYASTRRFRNVVYLRVEDVDGAENVDLAPARNEARVLNGERRIDYDRVFQLKTRALEQVFRIAPEPRGLDSYLRVQGRALRNFANFNVRCERHGPAWRSWLACYPGRQVPSSPSRRRDAARRTRESRAPARRGASSLHSEHLSKPRAL